MSIVNESIVTVIERTAERTLGDHIFIAFDTSITKTNLSTSWVNLIPLYGGRPFLIDTAGYSKFAIQVFWRKAGGSGRHDLRIVNHNNESDVFLTSEGFPNGMLDEPNINELLNQDIPSEFIDYRGKLRIQVKSDTALNNPVFDGLYLYLIR